MLARLLAAAAFCLFASGAWAQQVKVCVPVATTAAIGGAYNCLDVTTANPFPAGPTASSTGGATPTHVVSTASTNATAIKTTGGTVYSVTGINTNATTAFLKLYDVATGTPTCNTSTVVATYPMVQNVPFSAPSIVGKNFVNGIGLCITGAIADNDNTNATTGIAVSVDFK